MKALKVTVYFFALFSQLLKNYIPREVLNLYACIIIKCEVKSVLEIKVGEQGVTTHLSFIQNRNILF